MTHNIQLALFQDNALGEYSQEKISIKKFEKIFGLEFCTNSIFSGHYGIPTLPKYTGIIPEQFITISEINTQKDYSYGVTFFDDDYILEKIWNNPISFAEKAKHFKCVAEPDFSLQIREPLCVQIANTYRNHALALCFQEHSAEILPSPSWSTTQSYEFCFDGYEKGGSVMVSTIGTMKDERSRMYFKNGFFEMLRRISPDAVALYGDVNEELLSWMPKQLHIQHVKHNRYERARKHG